MVRNVRRRRWGFAAALLLVGMAAYVPCANFLMAGKLLSAVRSVASGYFGQDLPVDQKTIRTRFRDTELEAILYAPRGVAPSSGVILIPGISALGCYHPKMVALSRFLAHAGFLVLTPDIVPFREFQVTAEPIHEVLAWFDRIHLLEEGKNLKRVGLSGVSFSGTLALIAASRPEIRERIGFVMGIGCYSDLHRLSSGWFRAAQTKAGGEQYPTRFYAKWLMMLSAREMVPLDSERHFLQKVLLSLLLQVDVPEPKHGLSPAAQRWYNLAVAPEDQSDEELARAIEEFLTSGLFQELDPRPSIPLIRCPVFLVHGDFDDLIPAEESRQLEKEIVGAESHLLVSPFLTHTNPWEEPLSWARKAGAGIEACAFLYAFARVIR